MKIKVGIIGGAGYTAGELLRLLINHPHVEIRFIHSKSNADKFLYHVHDDLFGETDLKFSNTFNSDIDLVFLCVSHNEAEKLVSQFPSSVKIIDLSQDHRINGKHSFVYGLPELNKERIKTANYIANPGCFATAIQLALLPLAKSELLHGDLYASCTTGSTGAGQSLVETSHFSWRQNNLSVYKAFTHQHLLEINQSLLQLYKNYTGRLHILPQRGSFTRGILACITLKSDKALSDLQALYESTYKDEAFVFLTPNGCHLKQVVNTNKCLLYLEKNEDNLLIVSVIDNLLKGASGQAVQNMNLMFGLPETIGLKLKPSAF
ncbi:N-acetyl-gamma-glutamyl-phosphate reductase [Flavobacterium oreochromis]|uniref:N-acetyl-gamma-glutamyl-phosphate reductase n=2 Tax=Flavobacterium TaxID=237 RepID=A0A246G8D9_9FLAO|nr:N-acetyl-gamma-glutamyl-phosphate reductase [Flavobacterium oreochromis]OWP74928.1 N-acetyl-gamma-glutamyl-phosphate reductase [Flavobacterium oreochromis]OWP75132.1 N-acetyl-gamma-glutamyl-phosphate reductase [Flavobacterium oreochromis]POR24222.1 N-acetyl-gamma-glutamyl-phosphate reductase [Flavobacterium columnare]QYS87340.1 N-acetyl-gamma-glutamyl-phosphate reductase [Flavobacterium oreochromis]